MMTEQEFEQAAEHLNEALGAAEDLFARTFCVRGEVTLDCPGLVVLEFRNRKLTVGSGDQRDDVRTASLLRRLAVARAFPALWQVCQELQRETADKIRQETEALYGFIRDHDGLLGRASSPLRRPSE